jgi:hypothetical protein
MARPSCDTCGKKFKNNFELINHEKKKCKNKKCKDCGSTFRQHRDLVRHQNSKNKITCDCCQRIFCNIDHQHKHLRQVWKKTRGDFERDLVEYNQPICPPTAYEHYDGYIQLLHEKHNDIKTQTVKECFKVTYNYAMQAYLTDGLDKKAFTYQDLKKILFDIYAKQGNTFKINLGFGSILYQVVDEIFKYYYVSNNNLLFETAITISNRRDLIDFIKKVMDLDLMTNFYLQKPSSSWVLVGLPNVKISIFEYEGAPILG